METIQTIIRPVGSSTPYNRVKRSFNARKNQSVIALLLLLLAFVAGCKKDSSSGDATGDSNLIAYNGAVISLNQSLEDFISKSQTYESTNFTIKTHDESKAIVDAFIQSGEKLKSDMDLVMAHKQGATGSLKSAHGAFEIPCGPYDLVPGNTGQIQVGLVKSVADLISETKGDVAVIETKYKNGEIDENTYNTALNTLKVTKCTKAVNLGFGAIMGTGASIATGIIVGVTTAPAIITVTGVGLVVGTAVTWLANKVTGTKLKKGQSGDSYFLTTGKSKIGDPIPSTMMENGSDLTICIDGYAPVFLQNQTLPVKGHELTIQIAPVKLEDAKTAGTTEVCFIDKEMEASTCEQVQFVTAVPNPLDPGPGEGVTVVATIIPVVAGCDVSFSIVGTDGYTKSGTYGTDANGNASFYIPGGAAGVVDHVTITSSNGKTFVVTYVF